LNERLRVEVHPSRWVAAAILASHGLAVAAAIISLPPVAALIVLGGLGLSVAYHVGLAMHRFPLAVTGLELSADGALAIQGPGGSWLTGRLSAAFVPAPWLAVLTLRDSLGRARVLVVLPDALDPEAFRRLRVWLRWRDPRTVPAASDDDPQRQ